MNGVSVVCSFGAILSRGGQTVLCSLVLSVLIHRLLQLILNWQQADTIDRVTLKGFLEGWLGAHVPANNSVIYPWKMAAAHLICSNRNSL